MPDYGRLEWGGVAYLVLDWGLHNTVECGGADSGQDDDANFGLGPRAFHLIGTPFSFRAPEAPRDVFQMNRKPSLVRARKVSSAF